MIFHVNNSARKDLSKEIPSCQKSKFYCEVLLGLDQIQHSLDLNNQINNLAAQIAIQTDQS